MALCGRLAVVTGGGSGIGRAICHDLARQGATVVVCDIDSNKAKQTVSELTAGGHGAYTVDVARSQSVTALFDDIKKSFSLPVSIVVNCAGILKRSPLVDMSEEFFDEIMGVNLKGTFLVTKFAVREMLANKVPGGGTVVNIASIWGKTGSAQHSAYSASKSAVEGFTRSLALELGGDGIRCNAVLPGYTDTPMTANNSEEAKAKDIGNTPLGRAALPEEVARVVTFLCGPDSSFMTGASIEVTGGYGI